MRNVDSTENPTGAIIENKRNISVNEGTASTSMIEEADSRVEGAIETNYEYSREHDASFNENEKVLSTSAEELIKRSRQIPVLVERGIFDGLSTRARAVVYHHQENKILECMRSAFSERKKRIEDSAGRRGHHANENVSEGPQAPPSWKSRSAEEITAYARSLYERSFLSYTNRKLRTQICRRWGIGKLACLSRQHYLKRCVMACLVKNMAERLALDTSDESGHHSTQSHLCHPAKDEDEGSAWEMRFDDEYQAWYYYNRVTGASEW